jgi:hypothetical protein
MQEESNVITTESNPLEVNILKKLDYNIKNAKERVELVDKLLLNTPPETLTNRVLEKLADYIVLQMDKEERKEKKILTANRLTTVNKRETSYQGMADKLENGEDGIYGMLSDLGKAVLLTPKIEITEEDLEDIPNLKELVEEIEEVEELQKQATGRDKYILKKQLIQMRQQQYILKEEYRKPNRGKHVAKTLYSISLEENITIDDKGEPVSDGLINFFNPLHISALLRNYSDLKESVYGRFDSDLWYVMEDLDELVVRALEPKYPIYLEILILKVDGKTNHEIQDEIDAKFGKVYSPEYLSHLWRNKIPKIISEKAKEEYLLWYYTEEEYGKWKTCSCCGQTKLAHNRFFSKNGSSKDGYYSICKECRNKKNQEIAAAKK